MNPRYVILPLNAMRHIAPKLLPAELEVRVKCFAVCVLMIKKRIQN